MLNTISKPSEAELQRRERVVARETPIFADGQISGAASADDGDFITAWAARHGFGDNIEAAMTAIAEIDERRAETNGSDYREAVLKLERFDRDGMMAVYGFKGNRAFALDCYCLGRGWTAVIGCSTQVELAKRWKCTKANVEKCMGTIQALCKMPPAIGQREKEACKKMSDKRKGQLKK